MANDDLTVTLSQPITYASKGNQEEGSFIVLKAPTSKNMTECAALKQAFFRALPTESREEVEEPGDGPGELTGEAVMTLITMSQGVDLGKVLLTGKELLTAGVAFVEGEEKLTKPLFELLSQDDVEALVGEYMANFILASAWQRLKKS